MENYLDIDLNKIKQKDNSRSLIKNEDLHELMQSIKTNGLLQPIGLSKEGEYYNIIFGNRRFLAFQKLGYKQIPAKIYEDNIDAEYELILNLTENIHRNDVSAYDMGRYILALHEKHNLSFQEISVRISMSISRVKSCALIYKKTPKKFSDKIKFLGSGEQKKGFIPSSIASSIINFSKKYSLTEAQIEQLFIIAQKDQKFSADKVNIISCLFSNGINFEKALKLINDIIVVRPSIPIMKKDYEKIKETFGLKRESMSEIFYSNKKYNLTNPKCLK